MSQGDTREGVDKSDSAMNGEETEAAVKNGSDRQGDSWKNSKEQLNSETVCADSEEKMETGDEDVNSEKGDGQPEMTAISTDSIKKEVLENVSQAKLSESDTCDADNEDPGEVMEEAAIPEANIKEEEDEKPEKTDTTAKDDKSSTNVKSDEDKDAEGLAYSPAVETEAPSRRSFRQRKVVKEDTDSQDSKVSSVSSKEDKLLKPWEPWKPTAASEKSGWHLVCEVVEDWEHLASMLDSSSTRSEKSLLKTICSDFLPEIPAIQEEKVGSK